jgi:type I restriction enzyme R subunit
MTSTLPATSAASIHKEVIVEQRLVEALVAEQGYIERYPGDIDRVLALDRELVLRFLKETQAEEWTKLESFHASSSEAVFFKQLEKQLKEFGTLDVLRNGIKLIPGIHFRLCYFQPASSLNPALVRLYESNLLSVIRQVNYSLKNDNCIDVVLFVNGIPVATLEVKNLLTGTSFKHAEKQYRTDRSPAGEPLLTFKRGALVHFALDEENVSMTTKLRNGATTFLPFNRGREGGAGNPDIADDFRIAYLYRDLAGAPIMASTTAGENDPSYVTMTGGEKAVLGRETWLSILGNYLHLERDDDGNESMIFPRFQQLDATRKLFTHARAFGSGHNYLIQHSAGSGKSNTIAWTAHQAIKLHDDRDQSVFDTVIVVTDRRVLDTQLQNTITQFEQTQGVVRKIDGTSKQLREALESGARIIVSTIQKFGTEHLATLSGQSHRKFALIIDEAHSSQSGKTAQALSDALTREMSSEDVEDIILAYQKSRGPQPNISYFAFTATPRNVTLERFGTPGPDGLPKPFHLYSMRQAIDEGFILDVLQNYMTYQAYYELEKAIDSDPKLRSKTAQRRVAKFAHLHPTAIVQKVEVMVEHFRRHVLHELHGQAKGMVVTASREAAVKYYFGMKRYIEQQGYADIHPLVAFAGEIVVDGETWTEPAINGFSEKQLPGRFDGESYQLLIVAEKYQTGFDQPKLSAMYVDKKLDGLQAVQTLSRLNRIHPDKRMTFVLDFQNSIEDIQAAFKPFFEVSEIEERSDPNQIYQLEARLFTFGVLDPAEIDRFAEIFYKGPLQPADRALLEGIVKAAVPRFEAEEDEGKQEEFRQLLKSYGRFYSFVSQVISLQDPGLEKLSSYGAWLVRLLPDREAPADIEITDDMLRLHAFKIEQKEAGIASLGAGDAEKLKSIQEFAAKPYSAEEERSLSEVIKSFNERWGTQFTEADFLRFEQVNASILDENMIQMLRNNPPDVVYSAFAEAFFTGAIKLFQRDADMKNIILSDPAARDNAIRHFFNRAIRQARI